MVRFIGISEFLGAIGLILPAATKIKPSLTPLAALGLLTIMILAMAFHLSRGEVQATPVNIVLGGLAAFVAWGRTKRAAISSCQLSALSYQQNHSANSRSTGWNRL